jgi:hypothetical protein
MVWPFMFKQAVLAICVFMFAACGDDASVTNDLGIDLGSDGSALSCMPGSCAKACAADELCATSLGGFNRHAPTCLKKCAVTADCTSGMRCVDQYAEMLGSSTCISLTDPPACGMIPPTYHCDFPPASCIDANTLSQPISQAQNGTCGHELIRCPTACIVDADGGTGAHCE